MVTGQGLAGNLKQRFPRWLLLAVVIALLAANTINIAADLAGMADAAAMLSGINSHWFVVVFALLISWATVRVLADILHRCRAQVAGPRAFCLSGNRVCGGSQLGPGAARYAGAVDATQPESVGNGRSQLGTTISPYLFFTVRRKFEEEKSAGQSSIAMRKGATSEELELRNIDVGVGAFFSEYGHVLYHSDHCNHPEPARHHKY